MIKSSTTLGKHNLPQLIQHESGMIILEVDTNEDTEQEWVSGTIISHGINPEATNR